jgi:archaellum biogenesis protein FlaJ (TadC family)
MWLRMKQSDKTIRSKSNSSAGGGGSNLLQMNCIMSLDIFQFSITVSVIHLFIVKNLYLLVYFHYMAKETKTHKKETKKPKKVAKK